MKNTFTTTLDSTLFRFLSEEASRQETPRNRVLEEALKMYRKAKLKKEVEEGLKERQKEYKKTSSEFLAAQRKVWRKQ